MGRRANSHGRRRTFATWIRTGLALTTAGLASAGLMTLVEPQWLVRVMGAIFIVLGGTIFVLGFRTYRDVSKNLKEEEIESTAVWLLGLLTLMLLLAAALALLLVSVCEGHVRPGSRTSGDSERDRGHSGREDADRFQSLMTDRRACLA